MSHIASPADQDQQIGNEFRIHQWRVDRLSNTISDQEEEHSLSPKAMDLLIFLARNQGRIVTKDEIFEAVWSDTFVGDAVLWKRISELRQAFGDDPKDPQIIQTVPKRGYRLAAPVAPLAATIPSKPGQSSFLSGRALVAISLLVVSIVALVWWNNSRSQQVSDDSAATPPHTPMILVADIENLSGDPLLDGILRYALEQNLVDSGSVRVVSRSRIEDALRLMRKPLDSSLNGELARQVSLRDGKVDTLLVGRIDKLGAVYQMGLRVIDPSTGETSAATTFVQEDRDQLLSSTRELAIWTLNHVGAPKVSVPADLPTRRVTTDSLEAFQVYLEAGEATAAYRWKETEILARQAIELDPEFASAHLLLAEALYRLRRHAEALEALDKAVTLQDLVSLTERTYIQALYHDWRDEFEAAATHYELFLTFQPAHQWATLNLTRIYKILGRSDLYENLLVRLAASRPNNPWVQARSAALLIELDGDLDRTRALVQRAMKLLAENSEVADPAGMAAAFLNPFQVWESWLAGDVEGAVEEADRIRDRLYAEKAETINVERHASMLGLMYLVLGKLEETRRLISDFHAHSVYLPEFYALTRGEISEEDFQVWLRPTAVEDLPVKHLGLLVLFKLDSPIARGIDWKVNADGPESWQQTFRRTLLKAGLALRDGHCAEAISNFQRALEIAPKAGVWHMTAVAMIELELARAYEQNGELASAIEVLEHLSSKRRHTYVSSAPLWILGQAHLLELYRKQGAIEKAQRIEEQLQELLKYADRDHPIRVELTS